MTVGMEIRLSWENERSASRNINAVLSLLMHETNQERNAHIWVQHTYEGIKAVHKI